MQQTVQDAETAESVALTPTCMTRIARLSSLRQRRPLDTTQELVRRRLHPAGSATDQRRGGERAHPKLREGARAGRGKRAGRMTPNRFYAHRRISTRFRSSLNAKLDETRGRSSSNSRTPQRKRGPGSGRNGNQNPQQPHATVAVERPLSRDKNGGHRIQTTASWPMPAAVAWYRARARHRSRAATGVGSVAGRSIRSQCRRSTRRARDSRVPT